MMSFPEMHGAMEIPSFANPYSDIISDYVHSYSLQENPDAKIYYEALFLAVNEGKSV